MVNNQLFYFLKINKKKKRKNSKKNIIENFLYDFVGKFSFKRFGGWVFLHRNG